MLYISYSVHNAQHLVSIEGAKKLKKVHDQAALKIKPKYLSQKSSLLTILLWS